MVLFLNYKLVMFSSAITLVIILTSNTVLVTSSSESHHFVQHPQARRLLSSKDAGYNRKNLYGKMPPVLERDDSIKTENGLKSENGSDDNKYESSYKRAGSVTKKLVTKAAMEVVREIIDQNSACPVLGYNPNPINQLIYLRDNDQNIRYVDCNSLNNNDPFKSLANSKRYPNAMNGEDLRRVSEYAQLLPIKYSHIGEIYLPIDL